MSYTTFDRFVAWCRFRAAIAYVTPRSRVCDIGCGLDAEFLRYAQPQIDYGVGLDYQRFSNSRTAGFALIQCDLTQSIPLRSNAFDHAVMLAVLEHIENPRPMLAELYRVLAPGGSLIMTWPQPIVDPLLDLLHRAGAVSGEMESDKHQPRIPLERLISILSEIGFGKFKHRRFELGMNNLLVSWKS
jgi:ubiquinone/menaquinone biosynthesis C-methylase UbiE